MAKEHKGKDKNDSLYDDLALKGYFREIRKFEIRNHEEQRKLAKLAQEGDEKAKEKLIYCNQRFIVSVAKDYQHSGIPLGDLINEGNIGLIKAINKYDTERQEKFLSYAVWWIRQSMLQTIYDDSNTVRLPVNRINMTNKISRAKEKLTQQLNREPTAREIGELVELNEEDVLSAVEDFNNQVSLDSQIGEDSDVTLIDLIENESHHEIESKLNYDSLKYEINNVLSTLTERERTILELAFGLNGSEPQNLREIGQELDLTNERVRQIKELAIKKLRSFNKSTRLREFLSMKLS